MKFTFFTLLAVIFFNAFSQSVRIDNTVYTSNFENLHENEEVKRLFEISTLNSDSLLRYVKMVKPFQAEKGAELLREIEKNIPLNYSPQVKAYIDLYAKGTHSFLLDYLHNYYQNDLKEALKKQQLPEELCFLPAILSAYNPHTTNSTGGEGYWLLNYPQAIKFGLRITEYIDERRDLKKSTKAAILYIKQLHHQYPNWELTLAAFACGPTTINNLIHRKKTSNYWDLYPYLNPETRDIVPAFSAMLYSYSINNCNTIKINPKFEADTFLIEKKLSFKALTEIIDANKKELAFLNPSINKEIFPNNYVAILPKHLIEKLKQRYDSIYYFQDSILFKPIPIIEGQSVDSELIEETIYIVKSGDVLGKIAEKFHVKVSAIQQWNNLKGTKIDIGQKLSMFNKSLPDNVIQPLNTTSNNVYITYKVKQGDNLWDIAKNYPGISAEDIMELNNIDENLKAGQVLKIKKK